MPDQLYIVWDEKNRIGVSIIDEQHRSIVSTINTFYYYVSKGAAEAALRPIVIILEQYTRLHFQLEEAIMRENAYPQIEEHQALHAILMKETQNILTHDRMTTDPYAVLTFLKNWWLGHINQEDRAYVPYVRK